jgi:hypothetical protein
MQQQIEFEAMPFQHTVRIPDYIPDGVSVRVILSFDDAVTNKKPLTQAQQILQCAWGCVEKPRTIESIDDDIAQMRGEWDERQNGF